MGKAGASPDLISLPQGGGAIKGLGEKFSPDLHTGSGNFSIPLTLPPGRHGLQPALTLSYSTGNGNGAYGLGWSLGLPGVSRLSAKGIPRYQAEDGNAADVFVLSGAEDLVPVESSGTTLRYQPRTEGLFARITHHRDADTDHWEVRSKDGLLSCYGTPDARAADPAVVFDPAAAEQARIYTWHLSATVDPYGNRIEYEYERDHAHDGPHDFDQIYLTRIRYADYNDAAGQRQFLISVSFEYEDRPDPFSDYRAGFEIRTRKRCTAVVVRSHPETGREIKARSYALRYLDQLAAAAELPPNGVSLLAQVQPIGYDDAGQAQQEMPPLEFGYSLFKPQQRRFTALEGRALPLTSLGHPDFELVDLFGHGLPDIVEFGDTMRYWRNLGQGRFDLPRTFGATPAAWRLADTGVQILDANGDGRADLLVSTAEQAGYYPLDFRGGFSSQSFQRYRQAPSFNLEDPEVRLIDLTGDGVSDALRSGSSFECYFNHPKDGWLPANTRRVQRQRSEAFPDVNFSDPRVKLADLNGDGLQDIVLVHAGRIDYWPQLGYGRWGARISTSLPGQLPWDFDPQRVLLGDVDGDGLADLLYVSDREVSLWINRSGNGWSEPITIRGTPAVSTMVAVRLVDLLGQGVGGLLWTRDGNGGGPAPHFFLDFTGGAKPYLLERMDNNLGAVTEIGYTSSTTHYLRDQASAATRWDSTLPFPVQVVEHVKTRDLLSGGTLSTEYRYHHGHWDGVEREFRGFGMVEQLDTEVFDSYAGRAVPGESSHLARLLRQESYAPPMLTRSWFHQGPLEPAGDGRWSEPDRSAEYWMGDPQLLAHTERVNAFVRDLPAEVQREALRTLRGSVLRSEVYALDGSALQERPYTVTEQAYALRAEAAPADRIFFVMAAAQRTTQWERGDDPQTQLMYSADYDACGQARRQISIACPRGWRALDDRPAAGFLATLSTTDYAAPPPAGPYLCDRVVRSRSFEIGGSAGRTAVQLSQLDASDVSLRLIGETLNYYDGNGDAAAGYGAYTGLPLGRLGKYGALVRSESLVMTPEHLQAAYGNQPPPYLLPGTSFTTDVEYPAEFVAAMPALAGLVYRPASVHNAAGYFAIASSKRYDFHSDSVIGRGLILAQRDPLGQESTIDRYDHQLLPSQVTGPTGLTVRAEYDYRVLQPRKLIDPNGNISEVAYTPDGLLSRRWVRGKPGRHEGDVTEPCERMEYGLRAYHVSKQADRPQAVYVRVIRRIFHDSDADGNGETIEARSYSDGFGRLLQTRTQGDSLRWGDALFGGGDAVLPADQAVDAGAVLSGMENVDPKAPNVIVSGWQRYDNKGRVIEKYEPFYGQGWAHEPHHASQQGARLQMHYDPRGQLVRTVYPDGSEQRLIHGIPMRLTAPPLSPWDTDHFEPTPWETYTYDPNDNAGRTHVGQGLHASYAHHYDTPASLEIDALGRTVRTVVRHRGPPLSDGSPAPMEEHVTRTSHDIQGRVVGIRDALGRLAYAYVYDLAGQTLRTESLDAGRKLGVFDAAGRLVESRDAKGALRLRTHDALDRMTRLWARDADTEAPSLREVLSYDEDAAGPASAADRNLRGKLCRHQDEAGIVTIGAYDFGGRVLSSSRQLLSDEFMLSGYRVPAGGSRDLRAPRIDWNSVPPQALDTTVHDTRSAYDALGRLKWSEYPQARNEQDMLERYRLRPAYNWAGALQSVELEGPLDQDDQGPRLRHVQHIAYNARGQRVLIAYGNGLMTRYAYDAQTCRLLRMRTERYTQPDALSYRAGGGLLQEWGYAYDLCGNLLRVTDLSPGSGVQDNPGAARFPALQKALSAGDALVREFSYDPLYRLVEATGRECSNLPVPRPAHDRATCGYGSGKHGTPDQDNAAQLTALYRETYAYDPAGNLLRTTHRMEAAGASGWSRHYGISGFSPREWQQQVAAFLAGRTPDLGSASNRITHFGQAETSLVSHAYDASGNLLRENTDRHFEWDHADRMKAFRNQAGAAEPTIHAMYLYGADGQRVKKLVIRGQDYQTTSYLGAAFEHHTQGLLNGTRSAQNFSLHVMDGPNRIAIRRIGAAFADDGAGEHALQYHLGDYLGSSTLVADATGGWINREEFFPHGETSYGGFSRKRYRFLGKERDAESGLDYFGARYLASHLGRWTSSDPLGASDGVNAYRYVHNQPINKVDPWGTETQEGPNNVCVQPYNKGGGDHIRQVASGTDKAGAARNTAANYSSGLANDTQSPLYNDAAGQKVETAMNKAAWGQDVKFSGNRTTVTGSGDTNVGGDQSAQPSTWFEAQKSNAKQVEAGLSVDESVSRVMQSDSQLTSSPPKRVPQAPSTLTKSSLGEGQSLSSEMPLSKVQDSLPVSKPTAYVRKAGGGGQVPLVRSSPPALAGGEGVAVVPESMPRPTPMAEGIPGGIGTGARAMGVISYVLAFSIVHDIITITQWNYIDTVFGPVVWDPSKLEEGTRVIEVGREDVIYIKTSTGFMPAPI